VVGVHLRVSQVPGNDEEQGRTGNKWQMALIWTCGFRASQEAIYKYKKGKKEKCLSATPFPNDLLSLIDKLFSHPTQTIFSL
jgi:hypothetical protein